MLFANQFDNLANVRAHVKGTAREIRRQAAALGRTVDAFAMGAGTGGTVSSTGVGHAAGAGGAVGSMMGTSASNSAAVLQELERFEEARSLLCRTMPVARRVLGKSHEVAIKMLWTHAMILYEDDTATLDDLRKLVNTLDDAARGARQVYGNSHPFTDGCDFHLQKSRAVLAARETPSPGSA